MPERDLGCDGAPGTSANSVAGAGIKGPREAKGVFTLKRRYTYQDGADRLRDHRVPPGAGGHGAGQHTNDVPDKAKEPVAEGGREVTRGRRLTEN